MQQEAILLFASMIITGRERQCRESLLALEACLRSGVQHISDHSVDLCKADQVETELVKSNFFWTENPILLFAAVTTPYHSHNQIFNSISFLNTKHTIISEKIQESVKKSLWKEFVFVIIFSNAIHRVLKNMMNV